ncbi:hypothetical protein M9H77_08461 [Catharanthus roseus]|uniref:Uncharacterized protein n=1 Tax=Catharanthus roseus TaxID=4058 RepID=A0ACC0BY14_CATRO|nr:hypothetical protein M9H77_08461 [Catharanthus roseus]
MAHLPKQSENDQTRITTRRLLFRDGVTEDHRSHQRRATDAISRVKEGEKMKRQRRHLKRERKSLEHTQEPSGRGNSSLTNSNFYHLSWFEAYWIHHWVLKIN